MLNETYDVLIIGSGHAGGMAAKILTEYGIRCLMLNAGPVADVSHDAEKKPAYELPLSRISSAGHGWSMCSSRMSSTRTCGWMSRRFRTRLKHDQPYNWVRVRLFGGRSLFWSRQSFRLSDYEFKAKSHDGFGEDWPISHADLAPYYSRVEGIFRVAGALDGPPQMPNGNFILDDAPWSSAMQRFMDVAKPTRHSGVQTAVRR